MQQTSPASRDARAAPPMRSAAATIPPHAIKRLALDHVAPGDIECQPDNEAIAVIAADVVDPVELSPAGIVVTARPLRGRGSSWE